MAGAALSAAHGVVPLPAGLRYLSHHEHLVGLPQRQTAGSPTRALQHLLREWKGNGEQPSIPYEKSLSHAAHWTLSRIMVAFVGVEGELKAELACLGKLSLADSIAATLIFGGAAAAAAVYWRFALQRLRSAADNTANDATEVTVRLRLYRPKRSASSPNTQARGEVSATARNHGTCSQESMRLYHAHATGKCCSLSDVADGAVQVSRTLVLTVTAARIRQSTPQLSASSKLLKSA